jgi:hypothetical protein
VIDADCAPDGQKKAASLGNLPPDAGDLDFSVPPMTGVAGHIAASDTGRGPGKNL